MGDVNFKIVPEASVFRGDAYFDGPGAQKYHFWRKRFFGKYFSKISSEKYFSWHIFSKICPKIFFGKIGLGATLVLGVGPEKLLQWFTPWFLKTFLVTKRVAVRAFEAFPGRIAVIFYADAESEVKSDVASYFWVVFLTFLGLKFWSKFLFFLVGAVTKEKRPRNQSTELSSSPLLSSNLFLSFSRSCVCSSRRLQFRSWNS